MKIKNNLYIEFFHYIKKDKKMYALVGILMITIAVISIQCPRIIVEITDKSIKNGDTINLARLITVYFILNILLFLANALSDYTYIKIGNMVKLDLRTQLVSKISKFSGSQITESKTGELMSVVQHDVENIQEFVTKMFFNLLSDIITALGLVTVMIRLEYRFVLIAAFVQIFVFMSQKFFNKRIYKYAMSSREVYGKSMSALQEFINSLLHFLFINSKHTFLKRYFDILNDGMIKNIKVETYASLNSNVYQLIGTIQSCIIFGYGGYMVINGEITMGIFMVFITYIQRLFSPFLRFSRMSGQLKMIKISIERIIKILRFKDEEMKVCNTKNYNKEYFKSEITFNNVSFSYDNKINALKNLNIKFKFNRINAIVGSSGSGKTTIINLLFRIWNIKEGEICIGNTNIKDFPIEILRKNIIVISQTVFLLDDSIKNNISLYDINISDKKINEIIKVVGLDEFIKTLPNGIDTNIGENGLKLSGGQRQKISIARALIREAPIIIFDEATSAMDNISENLIMENIKEYLKNKTVIMIAHRLSTIEDADIIHVIKDGNVVESGSHEELLLKGNEYRKLYAKKVI